MVKVPPRAFVFSRSWVFASSRKTNFFPLSWPNGATASGNGSLQKPTADWIDGWFAAIGKNGDANSVIGRETDPRAAIVSAAVLFQDSADRLAQSDGPSERCPRL